MTIAAISLVRFAIFVVITGAIITCWHKYLWNRLVRDPALPEPWRSIVTVSLIALGISMPIMLKVSRLLSPWIVWPLAFVVYGWMGFAFFLLLSSIALDLARLIIRGLRRLARRPQLPDPERRKTLARIAATAVVLTGTGQATSGLVSARMQLATVRVRVPLRRLPAKLSGITLAQITDLHAGLSIDRAFVQHVVTACNALNPDIIAVTGDLVDGSVARLREVVAPLRDLRSRYGVFFVTGNHEYLSGVKQWLPELERLGMRVLRNERVSIGGDEASFDLAGVHDWTARSAGIGHAHDLDAALDGMDSEREVVLLAHQPRSVFAASARGVGLQVSGHTHGGQIFPWGCVVRLQQPVVRGLHRFGDTMLYVSRGVGYWGPPMRVGAPPEIACIELVRG